MSIDAYKKYSGQREQLRTVIVDTLKEHDISNLETRVDNFLLQLGSEIERKALDELKRS